MANMFVTLMHSYPAVLKARNEASISDEQWETLLKCPRFAEWLQAQG